MIAKLKGVVDSVGTDRVILDVNGVKVFSFEIGMIGKGGRVTVEPSLDNMV